MEESIQFIANCQGWQAVKKLKVTEATAPKTVMEFLASLGTGIDRKVEENLGKIIELSKLDSAIREVLGEEKKSIGEILEEINSRKINSVINSLSEKPELQKNEQKELAEFMKVYAMKKALKELKLKIDYSEIEIPGMRKIKKAKS